MSEKDVNIKSSDVYPSDLYLGGKSYGSINSVQNQISNSNDLNYVYINSPGIANNIKTQLYIDPYTLNIHLGTARIKHQTGTWKGQTLDYNIYVPTSITNEASGSGDDDTGGDGIQSIVQGTGIIVDTSNSDKNPKISVNTNTIASKDYVESQLLKISSIIGGGGGNSLFEQELCQLRQLLDVLSIEYNQECQKEHDAMASSTFSGVDKNISAFTYVPNSTDTKMDGLNYLSIKKDPNQAFSDVYCVIRKCQNVIEGQTTAGNVIPTDISYYLENSTPLCVSRNTGNYGNNQKYEWFFPKLYNYQYEEGVVYLITFHKNKTYSWSEQNASSIRTKVTNESSSKSKLQRFWQDSNYTDSSMYTPYAIFGYKKPKGFVVK